jgi:glycerophosphoryl diester phosphodiesterase
MTYEYFAAPKPRFLGHRGAAGRAPENTLIGFETAAAHTLYLESDVWLTRDSVPVLLHDESLLRTCGIDRKIGSLSWDELQSIDAGYEFSLDDGKTFPARAQAHRIPSLAEVLKKFSDKFFNLEIKDPRPEAVACVLEQIMVNNAVNRVLLAAENDEIMQRIRSEKPHQIPTSASHGEVYAFLMWLMKGAAEGEYSTAAQAFQIPDRWEAHDLASPQIIGALHAMGVEVHYWTINDPDQIRKLLAAGADGIVTDFPDVARDF